MPIEVTYNDYDLPRVIDTVGFKNNYETVTFTCNFLVLKNSANSLETECLIAESKLREKFQSLVVDFDGTDSYNLSHSDNTCLNPKVSVTRVQSSRYNSLTSREYSFVFEAELPADLAGFDFRREHNFQISKSSTDKRIINFHLVYTASPSPNKKTSLENYNTFALAYVNTILTALGGSYNPIGEDIDTDDQQKVTMANLKFEEIFEDELDGVTNSDKLVNVSTQYSISKEQLIGISNNGYFATPQIMVSISYSAQVKKSAIAAQTDIEQLYRTEIIPWIIKRSRQIVGLDSVGNAGNFYLTSMDGRSYDPTSNTISCKFQFVTPLSGGDIIALDERIDETFNSGDLLRKLWNGIPNSFVEYQMGSTHSVIRTTVITKYDSPPSNPEPLDKTKFKLLDIKRYNYVKEAGVGSKFDEDNFLRTLKVHTVGFVEVYQEVNFTASQVQQVTPGVGD